MGRMWIQQITTAKKNFYEQLQRVTYQDKTKA